MDRRTVEILLDIPRGLPKQASGDAACTRRALEMCEDLPESLYILDVGCGPGMQTLTLAEETGGRVTGGDIFDVFIYQLGEPVEATQREIDVRREFSESYGYEFFVGRK